MMPWRLSRKNKKSFGVIEHVMQQLQKAHAPTLSRRGHFAKLNFYFHRSVLASQADEFSVGVGYRV